MVIKKKKETFNDYSVEMSWGQLNAIYRALEKDHADPLADELFAELGWYLENVPGPGEDEEAYKEAKDAEREAITGGAQPGMPDEGGRNPDLIGQEIDDEGGELEGAESPVGGEPEGGEEELGGGEARSPEAPSEADQFLDRPPQARKPSRAGATARMGSMA
jgi:hypothetical protein